MDEATQQARAEAVKTVAPHLELQVLSVDRPELRLPFYSHLMPLGEHAPALAGWTLVYEQERVHLTHPAHPQSLLQPGQSLELEGVHLTLLDLRQPPLALLSGMDGRSWQLYQQRYQVGRRGRRLNHIELNEPTVSRQHASLIPGEADFSLLCESGSSATLVNDLSLGPGEQRRLAHGDIIRFGETSFRYINHAEGQGAGTVFGLKTLGTFELQLNGKACAHEGASAKTRWLIGLLGARWGQPVAVEWIIGQFWPDASTSRARKNLGVALKQWRECLGLEEEAFTDFVLRSRTQLRLNPAVCGSHDFCDVKELVAEGVTSVGALDRLLELYQGGFLPDCYEDWAMVERDSLEHAVVDCLTRAVAYFGELGDLASARRGVTAVAQLAPSQQAGVAHFMEAALAAAAPAEAVSVFRELEARLKADELEPEVELMKLFYRAQGGL
ncbi:MAG: FHA domain-containing protein [Candidatus Eremiobacteraeota bacterium]|nr:FHA domain-containing protein [Candidatus Eremiobacteraeota bacterium]